MRVKIRVVPVAVSLAAALLMISCSSDSDSDEGSEPIAGANEGSEDPQGSESPEEEPTGQSDEEEPRAESDIELPDDVTLVFDWESPQDPDEAAALDGAAEYMRSIAKGVVEQNPDDPTYQGYATAGAIDYARTQIELWVDGGWTMHGTDRFYDANTEKAEGGAVTVEFCHDDSEMLGKDAQTGEALPPTEYEGYEYLYHYTIIMAEPVADAGFWQAASVSVDEEATQCLDQ
jgi:hypothetical protein